MRTYEKTHPWLTFNLDLRQANYIHWLLLGEAQSECQHLIGTPLIPGVAEELYNVYLVKGAIATTAIEGNTLTEKEAMQRLEGKLELPHSKEYLGQEVDNIIEACNMIGNNTLGGHIKKIYVENIKEYNRLVLKKLPLDEEIIPGVIRRHNVMVGRYRGAPPEDCEFLLEKLCSCINQEFDVPKGFEIAFGIVKAVFAHMYIAWIHPFGDGNGRTARLVEFQILLSVGVPATATHLLSNHYNLTRTEYYRHLDIAHKTGRNIFSFIEYALRGFIDGLKEQIEIVKEQQMTVHWENYIHDLFRERNSSADLRRRRLVIDLSYLDKPVPALKIRHISPRIAEAYANKTDKTVRRDVNVLIEMGLIKKISNGYISKKETMLAFLPPAIQDEANKY